MYHNPYNKKTKLPSIPGLKILNRPGLQGLVPGIKPGALPTIPTLESKDEKIEEITHIETTQKPKQLAKECEEEQLKYKATDITIFQQIYTVFFDKMPKVSDAIIDQIMTTIPNLESWLRLLDVKGHKTQSGFLHFKNIIGVALAFKIFPYISWKDQNLVVTCEDNTQIKMNALDNSVIENSLEGKSISIRIHEIQSLLDSVEEEEIENDYKYLFSAGEEFISSISFENDPFLEMAEPERRILKQEIHDFRARAIKNEQELFNRGGEYGKQRLETCTEAAAKYLSKYQPITKIQDFETKKYHEEFKQIMNTEPISDEQYAARIQNDKENMIDTQFLDKQRRWIIHEDTIQLDLLRRWENSDPESLTKYRDLAISWLHNYDDDKEAIRLRSPYYYDRGTWAKQRAVFRQREAEEDLKHESEDMEAAQILNSIPIGPISISLKPKVTINNNNDINETLTKSNKETETNISTKTSVNTALIDYVGTRIYEILGVKEQDLIDFIVNHVTNGNPRDDLVSELEGPLDEDAEGLINDIYNFMSKL